jgi:HlyD family secretion protein
MKTYRILVFSTLFLLTACGDKDKEYDASGIFETTEVIVSAKASGEILRLDVEEGQTLSQGKELGYIDTLQLYYKKLQLGALKKSTTSRVVDRNRQLASIRQQISIQLRERARFERLVKSDAATQKQLDDINYQIEILQKQLAAESERLSSSNSSLSDESSSVGAQVAQINEQISDCTIQSPLSGTVLAKYAEQGEFATPGKALFKVANLSDMKLRVYITADQLTQIKLGQTVKVYADQGESGRKEYAGKISWISDKAEFTPKTIQTRDERANLVYAVKIAVKNDGYIKDGMYGDIKF